MYRVIRRINKTASGFASYCLPVYLNPVIFRLANNIYLLGARRGKKKAIVAVAHSILKSVYHVLKDDAPYNELGADYLNSRMEKRRKRYLKTELEKMGYTR
jgi:hypothetical protein